jgi:hypothetical protein
MHLGFHPAPAHVLASRCNTIVRSRGETEPLDALDLQAAARQVWLQRGYTLNLPPLNQAPEGCQESPADTRGSGVLKRASSASHKAIKAKHVIR